MATNIDVGIVLHAYQPPFNERFPDVIKRICERSYRPLFEFATSRPNFCCTVNISWSLLELLRKLGQDDLLSLIRHTVMTGKVELMATVAYHPILPLATEEEAVRQVRHDAAGKDSVGLPARTCSGFYLPEYAYSPEIAPWLTRLGARWTVADDAIYGALRGDVPFSMVPQVGGLSVFLRSRRWGHAISRGEYDFDRLNLEFPRDVAKWFGGRPGYVILATDMETFGEHHRAMFDRLLKPMLDNWSDPSGPAVIRPMEEIFFKYAPGSPETPVPSGSWSTDFGDFMNGNCFPLWNSPYIVFHKALWKLVNVARDFGAYPEVAEDVMKMLSSCHWWQVSDPNNFNPGLMMFGAEKAYDIVTRVGDAPAKRQARLAFDELLRLCGIRH